MTGGAAGGREAEGDDPLRRRIAAEAARGVVAGSDARRAVFRAARRLGRGWVPADRLPGLDEVRARLDPRGALPGGDRFERIGALVGMLTTVKRAPAAHPEGDALEHALQVFGLVHAERPYDEELLTAALVHEVGLALDRDSPVAAALDALGDAITPRTRWLVESVTTARAYAEGRLGHRARLRFEAHPDGEAALVLETADRRGRVRGGVAPTLEEAIAILRELDREEPEDGSGV